MKKTFLILISLTITLFSMAQEKTKQKEVGLVMSNLNNFGLTYRFGNNKSLWRINSFMLNGGNNIRYNDSISSSVNDIGFAIKFGKEYHKEISDFLELRYGADLSLSYRYSKSEYKSESFPANDRKFETLTLSPGINFVLGVNYLINDQLLIGAEILPAFYYDYRIDTYGLDYSGFNFGLSSNSVMLSLTYRY